MGITITNTAEGADSSDWIQVMIALPDVGSSVIVAGSVRAPGVAAGVTVTGSPVTAPAVPGSGSTFWNIQADGMTGALSVQQSPTADPPLVTPTSVVIFRQTLVAGESADLVLDPSSTPDS